MLRNSFRITSNFLRILSEPFRISLNHSLIIPMVPNNIYNVINSLSVLPYGSGTLRTWTRHLFDQ